MVLGGISPRVVDVDVPRRVWISRKGNHATAIFFHILNPVAAVASRDWVFMMICWLIATQLPKLPGLRPYIRPANTTAACELMTGAFAASAAMTAATSVTPTATAPPRGQHLRLLSFSTTGCGPHQHCHELFVALFRWCAVHGGPSRCPLSSFLLHGEHDLDLRQKGRDGSPPRCFVISRSAPERSTITMRDWPVRRILR